MKFFFEECDARKPIPQQSVLISMTCQEGRFLLEAVEMAATQASAQKKTHPRRFKIMKRLQKQLATFPVL